MVAVLPYLYTLASNFRLFLTASSVATFASSDNIKGAVDSFHKNIDDIRVSKVSSIADLKADFTNLAPTNDDTVSIGINPTTLPDYMSIQSDMTLALTEQMRNISKQLEYQNTIATQNMKTKGESEAHLESIAKTLNSTLPGMILQLQEISKLTGIASMSSEIDVAYSELALQNHDMLIYTLENLQLNAVLDAPAVNVTNQVAVPSVTVTNDVAVPSVSNTINVPDQTQAIDSLTTATTAHTAELTGIKDNLTSVSDNAVKQKEIADYQTTVQDIKNLDGNVVANMKPMEAMATKNITDAKNATDEMEFEIPDDVIDEIIGVIPLPTYTTQSIYDTDSEIYDSWSSNE